MTRASEQSWAATTREGHFRAEILRVLRGTSVSQRFEMLEDLLCLFDDRMAELRRNRDRLLDNQDGSARVPSGRR